MVASHWSTPGPEADATVVMSESRESRSDRLVIEGEVTKME